MPHTVLVSVLPLPLLPVHAILPVAGKDRSGIFAAVILMVRFLSLRDTLYRTLSLAASQILGARDEDIIADYALTTIGLQPAYPLLAPRFEKEAAFRNNRLGAFNLGSSKYVYHRLIVRGADARRETLGPRLCGRCWR